MLAAILDSYLALPPPPRPPPRTFREKLPHGMRVFGQAVQGFRMLILEVSLCSCVVLYAFSFLISKQPHHLVAYDAFQLGGVLAGPFRVRHFSLLASDLFLVITFAL